MRIAAEEFAARREALAAKLEERGLAGCVLFDTHYVLYYTGFAFIPTERPIAFVLVSDGRGGMLVPRLEVEHAQANTAVAEIAHYDEYPGERAPDGGAARAARRARRRRADRRRPRRLSLDLRLPRAVAARRVTRTIADARRGPDDDQERCRDRAAPRELQVGEPRAHAAAAVHAAGRLRRRRSQTRAST